MDSVNVGKARMEKENILYSKFIFSMDRGEFVKEMKEKGSVVHEKRGIFPIKEVILYSLGKDPNTLKVLIEEELIPIKDSSMFLSACILGNISNIKLLLDYGANINSTYEDGDSFLLRIKIGSKYLNLLKVLLVYGIDLRLKTKKGNTFLHRISKRKYVTEYFDLLREFLFEAQNRGEEILKEVINSENNEGDTALILSSKTGKLGFLKEFLRCGADEKHINHEGKTFLDYLPLGRKSSIEEYMEISKRYNLRFKKGIAQK